MTSREQIKNYITNYFHPYFDITLNSTDTINPTEPVNFIIPIQFTDEEPIQFFEHNRKEVQETVSAILSKYELTDIRKEYKCKCTKVIDGDTIDVDILQKIDKDNNIINYETPEKARVRLVGVNTPESGKKGATVSKNFLEKLCQGANIYLNIDDKTPVDKYGRLLAVVILQNKNVNQILLKEGLAEIMFIPPSEFNPFDWDYNAHVSNLSTQNSNFLEVLPYINEEFNNLVFTNQDDYDVIHQFEAYKGMIYLKLYPYNKNIRLHILPRSYTGDSPLLLFKDEIITNDNITKQNCSIKTFPPINATTLQGTSIYEMEYDISNSTKNLNTLQINIGYSYPSTTTKVFHLTGIKDETNEIPENRLAFIDANYDQQTNENTSNNIAQPIVTPMPGKPIQYPTSITPRNPILQIVKSDPNVNINHINQYITVNNKKAPKIFHKTIKYINDDIYMYEESEHLEKEWGESDG